MANYRRGRINDETVKQISAILRTVKDPRVSEAFISVTAADVSADLKYAKIFYSFLQSGKDKKEVAAGLKSSAGYIRRELARAMNLRVTPELTFVYDESLSYGAHIASILNTITFSEESEEESADNGEQDQ